MKIIESIKQHAKTDKVAIQCDNEDLTYKDLDKYSDAIAVYLKDLHLEDNTPIVIYGNKDNMILTCMIAALKSGRAYIPLDVTFPIDRVAEVCKEVRPKVVFNFSDQTDFNNVIVINKVELENIIKDNENKNIDKSNYVKNDENAYILFTSGSTGKPKGVQISSDNIDRFEEWMTPYLNIDKEQKVMMNQVSYSFDISVISVYCGLIHGATLYSFPKYILEDYNKLFEQLRKSNMRVWVSTPSFANVCIAEQSFNSEMLPKLESMIFIGEVLPKSLVKELMDRFPNTRMINGYGPTEATVAVSAIDITKEFLEEERSLPVGYPMDTCIIKIVDENGYEVRDGEKGELMIIGPCVSKGYFKNPEKTKEVFYEEILDDVKYRAYKTGDLAFVIGNKIYYSGRKDFQIKLNGFRIEIEDIENNLRKVSNIKNAVVLPIYKDEKIAYLKGIVQLKEKNDLTNLKNGIAIKKELGKYVPSYMVPRNIQIIDQFPLNTNGKIDRKKLMEEI